jgi:hypothetical protein
MVNHNGVMSLWTRSAPTVTRAMLVTDAQLDSYDQNKETIIEHHEVPGGLAIQVVASFGAGVFASVASNSIDVLKTRVMNVLKTRMVNALSTVCSLAITILCRLFCCRLLSTPANLPNVVCWTYSVSEGQCFSMDN